MSTISVHRRLKIAPTDGREEKIFSNAEISGD